MFTVSLCQCGYHTGLLAVARLSAREQLKLFAIKQPWTYEELVLDCKQREVNQVYSTCTPIQQFGWIKQTYGSRWLAVRALRAQLRQANIRLPKIDHTDETVVKAERDRILRAYSWVLEEAMYAVALEQAQELFLTVKGMYSYLVEQYGSPEDVLRMLWHVGQWRRKRGKTLCLHPASNSK